MRKIIIGSEIPGDFDDSKYILYGYLKGDYNKMLSKIFLFDKSNEIKHQELLTYNNLTFEFSLSNSNKVIEHLNYLKNTYYPASFWEIIINPWWIYIIQFFHFQKKTVQKFIKLNEHEQLEFIALNKGALNFSFKDTEDFIKNGISNPDYNYWVISRIIEDLAPRNISISYSSKFVVNLLRFIATSLTSTLA